VTEPDDLVFQLLSSELTYFSKYFIFCLKYVGENFIKYMLEYECIITRRFVKIFSVHIYLSLLHFDGEAQTKEGVYLQNFKLRECLSLILALKVML
jgi:hypothetical protein